MTRTEVSASHAGAAVGTRDNTRRVDPLADALLRVETPEQVSIHLPLAGLGSRFAALLIDGLLILAALLGFLLVALALAMAAGRALGGVFSAEFLMIVLPAIGFVVTWGYFFAFEAFRDGATPGKRWLRLRVVQDGGDALNMTSAALRCLVRIVDLQPGLTGLVGGVVMLLHPRSKRLGDIVAGTVVVRDLQGVLPALVEEGEEVGKPELNEATFVGLERFLVRARRLDAKTSAKLVAMWSAHLPAHSPRGSFAALQRCYAQERIRRQAVHGGQTGAVASLVRSRNARWHGFQNSVGRLTRRKLALASEDRVAQFAAEYRAISADLARARTLGVGTEVRWALERLVVRAHGLFHRPMKSARGAVRNYFAVGLPRAVRARSREFALACLCFFGTGVVAYTLVANRPELEPVLVPAALLDRAELAAANPDFDYRDTFASEKLSAGGLTSMVMFNNVQVAFFAFAAGVLAGIGSLALLILNGVHLGGVMGAFQNRGVLENILAWVAPHGPFELTAIALAGAAGFRVGSALWAPGRLSRADAFQVRGKEALVLLGGAVALLVVAGVLEGFAAPARVAPEVKYTIGVLTTLLMVGYFGFAGRDRQPAPIRVRSIPGA